MVFLNGLVFSTEKRIVQQMPKENKEVGERAEQKCRSKHFNGTFLYYLTFTKVCWYCSGSDEDKVQVKVPFMESIISVLSPTRTGICLF